FGFGTKLDAAIDQREQGMVFTQTHVPAGVPFGAALARENVAGDHLLAAKNLDPQPLTVGVAAVTRGSACLLVSHRSPLTSLAPTIHRIRDKSITHPVHFFLPFAAAAGFPPGFPARFAGLFRLLAVAPSCFSAAASVASEDSE